VQSAKTVSLTQEQLEIHVTRLCTEIKVLDDKEQATAYETEAVKLLLEQRVTLLEEDLQAVRNRWKQEVEDFQKASAMELNSEREKLKQSAALKIKTLQENLNASEAMYTAEKAERERLAAEVEKAHDPFAWARKVQAAEEEAELLACRQKAKADELIRQPQSHRPFQSTHKQHPHFLCLQLLGRVTMDRHHASEGWVCSRSLRQHRGHRFLSTY
jgi:transcription-repair coupling factor (superfamily II helicase)